jgi:hypothetical protein
MGEKGDDDLSMPRLWQSWQSAQVRVHRFAEPDKLEQCCLPVCASRCALRRYWQP